MIRSLRVTSSWIVMAMPAVFVTRACTKAEKEDPRCGAARKTEIDRMLGFGTFGMPRAKADIVAEIVDLHRVSFG